MTELRKHVMPLDGTFDFWILLFAMCLSLFSAGMGIKTLVERDALLDWDNGDDSLRWIGVVFAIADATPGLLFLGYVSILGRQPYLVRSILHEQGTLRTECDQLSCAGIWQHMTVHRSF